MMRIGWNSGKKKADIGRLIDCFGLWEFCHCGIFVIAGIPSLRGFEKAEAISLKIPSKILYCVIPRLDRGISLQRSSGQAQG